MSLSFIVREKTIEIETTNTLFDLRQKIIKEFNLTCPYVDMKFVLERASRILGKFNVEPGLVPRTLDRYSLDRFAFKDTLEVEVTEVEDYKQRTFISGAGRGRGGGVYTPPVKSSFDHQETEVTMKVNPTYFLDSQDDFPSL